MKIVEDKNTQLEQKLLEEREINRKLDEIVVDMKSKLGHSLSEIDKLKAILPDSESKTLSIDDLKDKSNDELMNMIIHWNKFGMKQLHMYQNLKNYYEK